MVQDALPALQADLGTDLVTLQWVITFYSLLLLLGALILVFKVEGQEESKPSNGKFGH